MSNDHHTHAYRKARTARLALARQRNDPCALADTYPDTCPGWIDYTLTYPHPWSPTAEHGHPVRHGGNHNTITGVAHLHCQQRQGGDARTHPNNDEWDNLPPIQHSGTW